MLVLLFQDPITKPRDCQEARANLERELCCFSCCRSSWQRQNHWTMSRTWRPRTTVERRLDGNSRPQRKQFRSKPLSSKRHDTHFQRTGIAWNMETQRGRTVMNGQATSRRQSAQPSLVGVYKEGLQFPVFFPLKFLLVFCTKKS